MYDIMILSGRVNKQNRRCMVIITKRKQKDKSLMILIFLFVCSAAVSMMPLEPIPLRRASTFIYILTVIVWAVSIRQRIIQKTMRRILLLGSACIVFLFILRLGKYDYFDTYDEICKFIDSAYYIPVSMLPLIAFLAAMCCGRYDAEKNAGKASLLFLAEIPMSVGYLTNSLHGSLRDKLRGYGPLYYVTVIWSAVLSVMAFAVILKRCRVAAAKEKWYIPLIFMTVGVALMTAYYINGGAIEIGEVKLYHFQDVVAFLFIAPFESLIQIGLIPSSSGYGQIFTHSHLNAVITDNYGRTVIAASGYEVSPSDVNIRVKSQPIPGGTVKWAEDISVLAELENELESVTEVLNGENDLIRYENELRQERVGYEIKNRLYDEVAEAVRPQSGWLRRELEAGFTDGDLRERLVHYAVVGVYIKRLCMMRLAAHEHTSLSSGELVIAIQEAFSFMSLTGRYCETICKHEFEVPAALLMCAYEIFENIIEKCYESIGCCGAEITDANGFSLTLSLDTSGLPIITDYKRTELSALSADLWTRYEDDTAYITIGLKGGNAV